MFPKALNCAKNKPMTAFLLPAVYFYTYILLPVFGAAVIQNRPRSPENPLLLRWHYCRNAMDSDSAPLPRKSPAPVHFDLAGYSKGDIQSQEGAAGHLIYNTRKSGLIISTGRAVIPSPAFTAAFTAESVDAT